MDKFIIRVSKDDSLKVSYDYETEQYEVVFVEEHRVTTGFYLDRSQIIELKNNLTEILREIDD